MTRRKLSADLIPRARRLAELGMPLGAIAEAAGVHRATLHRWRSEATADGLERDLCDAIEGGHQAGEVALVERLHAAALSGDSRTAQWLLCHCPAWRDRWSDSAAERRALAAQLQAVVGVIVAADLEVAARDRLLLQLQAAGLGACEAD